MVPGSRAVGAVDYVDRLALAMPASDLLRLRAAIAALARAAADDADFRATVGTPAFGMVRSLVIEAYYGDYAAPGYTGPDGLAGHRVPATTGGAPGQGLVVPRRATFPMSRAVSDRAEVIVVGSGAGGGLIAAELGRRGMDVLLIEAGARRGAESYTRFELRARRELWWPTRFLEGDPDRGGPMPLLAGRWSVGPRSSTPRSRCGPRPATSPSSTCTPA